MDTTQIEHLINDIQGPLPIKNVDPNDSDITLFQLMDEVANGRKLMNLLFSSEPVTTHINSNSHGLRQHQHVVAGEWYDEEKRGSAQVTSATLQLDTPVIFSWSDSGNGMTTSRAESPIVDPKKERKQITTNQRLLKSVSTSLKELGFDNIELSKFDGDIFGDELNNPYQNKNSNFSQDSINKEWKKSNFKVDPLQTFVVKELPKQKKPVEPEVPKSKSKKKKLLWFWSKGKSSKKKNEKDKESSEEQIPKEDKKIKKKSGIPAQVQPDDDDLWDHDLDPSSEEEEVIGLGLQRVSFDLETQEEVVRSFEPANEFDLQATESSSQPIPPAEPIQNKIIEEEDDDEDFGEFQQVGDPNTNEETMEEKLTNANLLDFEDVKKPINPIPPIDTFIPLQPKKK
ncbi:hypothetical protein RNJ44_01379 [Nakaseomyces bracarensis]|uniref:Uncharacterized protein n=1 Tax=Nakaseomyces bracarensis TaxID=273131 RepID=A0ABR4NPI2_9SACH